MMEGTDGRRRGRSAAYTPSSFSVGAVFRRTRMIGRRTLPPAATASRALAACRHCRSFFSQACPPARSCSCCYKDSLCRTC